PPPEQVSPSSPARPPEQASPSLQRQRRRPPPRRSSPTPDEAAFYYFAFRLKEFVQYSRVPPVVRCPPYTQKHLPMQRRNQITLGPCDVLWLKKRTRRASPSPQ